MCSMWYNPLRSLRLGEKYMSRKERKEDSFLLLADSK
jgi:hypothetical protein